MKIVKMKAKDENGCWSVFDITVCSSVVYSEVFSNGEKKFLGSKTSASCLLCAREEYNSCIEIISVLKWCN